MNGKLSIIIIMSVILVTAAFLTVQSPSSSMLQSSYAQLCPDGSTPDASGNCATEAPPATTETPPPAEAPPADASQGATITGGMSADWANSILAVHNSERAAVGVPPLVWSDSLAAGAQAWAEHLVTTRTFAHATDAEKGCPCGENIATFSWFWGPTSPNGGGTSNWVAEKQNWQGGVLTQENWYQTGHYTQMVWRNEQEVGCGAAPPGAGGPAWSTLVCQYNPPGNYIGQAPY